MWADEHCDFSKVHLGETGSHVGIGEKSLDGFAVMQESFESVLTHPNVQGLLMNFEDTYAYALLCGKINDEDIRMRPKEKWSVASKHGKEDFSVHPNDDSLWYPGDDRVEEHYHVDRLAFCYWLLELGMTYDELQKMKQIGPGPKNNSRMV